MSTNTNKSEENEVRAMLTFLKGLVLSLKKELTYFTTEEEELAFNTFLLSWAEGVKERHSKDGCYANVPADALPLDLPARTTPCLVCNITVGAAHVRAGGFFEALATQAMTTMGMKGHSPS